MRILFMSNSPFIPTGYGQTTASCAINFKRMGHDVAIFAFYGLEGTKIDWLDIPIFPNNPRDWGIQDAKMYYDYFDADVLISLIDIWVLKGTNPGMNWVPIVPVDHDPVPEGVIKVIKEGSGIIKVLTESRFGQEQFKKRDVDAGYISHPTNTEIFSPRKEARDFFRESYKWEDKFVIGTVATNHNERKNWNASLLAFKEFESRHKGEVIYYMHTNPLDERGINLNALRDNLGIGNITFVPKKVEFNVGIDKISLSSAYNCMDVFLLPSKGEGFGVPIIEAQACGVPVITTKCTSQEELLGGGWFIERLRPFWTQQNSWAFECDPMEIVERLEQAYQAKKDGSIIEMQKKAREKALEYEEEMVFDKYWKPLLDEIDERVKHPKKFKGQLSYKGFYEMKADRQDGVEREWRENSKDQLNKCGVWFEQNRTDISVRMLSDICKGKRVLAVGAARDGEASLLSQLEAKEIVRTDLIPDPKRNIMGADVENLPFEMRSFDVVICRDLIEHVIDEKRAMKEMSRVLKNKGYLLITCPNKLDCGVEGLEHVRGFSPKEFIQFLTNNGFKIIDKRGNVPNIILGETHGLKREPELLPEYQELSVGFDENPLSYYVSSQLFVLAQKK